MEKLVKTFLYKILNLNIYLKCMHLGFFVMFNLGILRKNSIYKYHYFVRNLISEGDYVIDIGANLGYFSKIFCNHVGKSGKVICFEPMPPFFRILQWAFKTKDNLVLYNCALGLEDKLTKIYCPQLDSNYFRTGLPNIPTQEIEVNEGITYEIEMRKGSTLLDTLPKIDYIKIDIEGYEEFVLPEIAEIIEKYKPTLQIETGGDHKKVVFTIMENLNYSRYSVFKNKLEKEFDCSIEFGDYLFIHKSKEADIVNKLKEINCA